MGGLAFARAGPGGEAPLVTPRMSLELYNQLRGECNQVISKFYKSVTTLSEAPGKKDFGDIDFIVQGSLDPDANEMIAAELKARRTVVNGPTFSLAIPQGERSLPLSTNDTEACCSRSTDSPQSPRSLSADREEVYTQVDIQCLTDGLPLDWVKFVHSFGDLGQIMGYLSYDLGFTSNDKGFHVRIAEQEKTNWYASMIFLTDSPFKAMEFFGLDKDVYTAGFETVRDLFDWVRGSRTAKRYKPLDNADAGSNHDEPIKKKSEHQHRMKTRLMFKRFINDVLPTLPPLDIDMTAAREDLLGEALAFFGKTEEYNIRISQVHSDNNEETARLLLSDYLVKVTKQKQDKVNEVVRAVRSWSTVTSSPPSPSVVPDGHASNSGPESVNATPTTYAIRDMPAVSAIDSFRLACLLTDDKTGLREEAMDYIKTRYEELKTRERKRVKDAKAERKAKKEASKSTTNESNSSPDQALPKSASSPPLAEA